MKVKVGEPRSLAEADGVFLGAIRLVSKSDGHLSLECPQLSGLFLRQIVQRFSVSLEDDDEPAQEGGGIGVLYQPVVSLVDDRAGGRCAPRRDWICIRGIRRCVESREQGHRVPIRRST